MHFGAEKLALPLYLSVKLPELIADCEVLLDEKGGVEELALMAFY